MSRYSRQDRHNRRYLLPKRWQICSQRANGPIVSDQPKLFHLPVNSHRPFAKLPEHFHEVEGKFLVETNGTTDRGSAGYIKTARMMHK